MEKEILTIFNKCNQVIDVELDYDDTSYDYDFLVTLKNNQNVYKTIFQLSFLIECLNLSVHTLYEQISDNIKENEEYIIIDFYISK